MKVQHIVVGGILKVDGKILMVRRLMSDVSSQGYWEFPKGRVEWSEDPETALKREFMEETNLRIEPIKINNTLSHTYKRDGDNIHMVVLEYLVALAPDEGITDIKLTEHDAYKWVDSSNIDEIRPIYESMKQNLLAALDYY